MWHRAQYCSKKFNSKDISSQFGDKESLQNIKIMPSTDCCFFSKKQDQQSIFSWQRTKYFNFGGSLSCRQTSGSSPNKGMVEYGFTAKVDCCTTRNLNNVCIDTSIDCASIRRLHVASNTCGSEVIKLYCTIIGPFHKLPQRTFTGTVHSPSRDIPLRATIYRR